MLSIRTESAQTAGTAVGSGASSKRFAIFLKYWTLGVIVSAILYGIAFALFASTFYLLHQTSKGKKTKVHYFLFFYIMAMFGLSTVSIVSAISAVLNGIVTQKIPTNLVAYSKNENAFVITFVIWGSDGFLLWRAAVLYEAVGTFWRILVQCCVVFLMVAQVATGTLYILSNFLDFLTPMKYSKPIVTSFTATTLAVNWIITGLVVFRLVQFRRRVSRTLGNNYGTPFGKIVSICVESAALIIIFATIFLVQNLLGENPFTFSRIFLVHIYVICPLLILYRVAQGKAFLTSSTSFYSRQMIQATDGFGVRSTEMQFSQNASVASSSGYSTASEGSININEEDKSDESGGRRRDMEQGGGRREMIAIHIQRAEEVEEDHDDPPSSKLSSHPEPTAY